MIYRAIGDFSDLIKDAAAARAEMAALSKATTQQGQAETDAASKAAVAHDKDTQSILAQKRAYDQLAQSAKAANVQTLYGGRQDMSQHLSDLSQEERWQELLLRQRNLGFSSPQAAFSWRQQELQQNYLMNRARFGATSSGTGFTTPNEYLAYLQKEYTALSQENAVLIARAAAYRANADAALQYGNALKGHSDTFGTLGTASSSSLAGIQQFNAALVGLPDTVTTQLDIDDSAALSKLAVYQSILRGVPQRVSTTDVITAAYASGGVNIPSAMPNEVIPISLGGPYERQLNALMAEIAQLSRDRVDIPVHFDLPDTAQVTGLVSSLPHAGPTLALGGGGSAGGGGGGPPPAARVAPVGPGGEDPQRITAAGNAAQAATPKLNDFHQTAYRGYGWWGLLNKQLTLFGGLLGSGGLLGHIALWHVLLDGIIEALAVLIPATVTAALGLTAFAAAAEPAAKGVAERMYSIYQVSQATNSVIPPMTDNFKKFQEAVKPQVIQLFGDALDVINKGGSTFGNLAIATGQVLDKLGARLTVFLTQGGDGFQKFLKTGADDLKMFGQLLSNLSGIFVNFLKATELTHIAEILLGVVVAFSKLVEIISSIPAPVLAALLALHGFIVWGGLATTLMLKLLDPIRAVAVALGGLKEASAVGALGASASGWEKLKATFSDIAAGFGALPGRLGLVKTAAKDAEAGLEGAGKAAGEAGASAAGAGFKFTAIRTALTWIAANPALAAIGALVAAFVILGVTLGRTKDATDAWIDSMNKAVATANNWEAIPTTLNAVAQSQDKVAQKSKDVAKAFQDTNSQAGYLKGRFGDYSGALVGVGRDLDNLQAANGRYSTQLQAQVGFLDQVSKKTGFDYPQAVALANIAGVKLSDITDKNSKEFKIALQQVQGLIDGYKAMGQQGGALGNDVNAVNLAMELQDTQVSKLNTAWDTFVGLVTGGEQAFQKFGTDMNTLTQAAKQAGASFDGLDKNSLALQSGFTGAIIDGNKLLDQFRQQAVVMNDTGKAQDLLTRGGKDLIATLIPMASKSKAAQDQLFALAQSAGYDGVNSLKALTKWSGDQGATGAEQDLLKVTGQLTGDVSDLAKDYQNLAEVLSTDVNKAMADSILQANNGQTAFLNFAQGIEQGSTDSKKFHDAATDIIKILIQQYQGDIPKAKAAFEAYAIQLGDTKSQADKLWESMHSKVAVELANQTVKTIPDAKRAFQLFAQDGLDYSKGKADDLWKEITSKLGPQLDGLGNLASGPAKNKFIDWAVNGLGLTRAHAIDLWKELVTLQQHIDSLHGKNISIVMVGNATYTIKDLGTGTTQAIGTHTAAGRGATGLYITQGTTPKADDVPIWASKGEYVVQADAVDQYGVAFMDALNAKRIDAQRMKRAGGGLVYSAGAQLPADYEFGYDLESTTQSDMQRDELSAMVKKLKSSEAAAKAAIAASQAAGAGVRSTALGGDEGANRALALTLFPWPQSMWPSYVALEMQEAGFNRFARNPSSGAYGIPQALPPTKMPFAAQAAGGSHAGPQISWMYDYIAGRYGNPVNAEAHEQSFHWYAGGGLVDDDDPNAVDSGGARLAMGGMVDSGVAGMAAMSGYASGGSTKNWKFPTPTRLHAYDVTDKGFRLGWDAVHGPSGQKPSGYTVETWQLNGKLVDKFIAHATSTAEYGTGGRGLHPGWSYRTFVWANGGPDAPPHAQMITALHKAKTVAGLPAISTTGQNAYQTWFKDYQILDRDYQQEQAALWALTDFKTGIGKKGGPTKGQASTWAKQLDALQAQQKRAFGVGVKPPGDYAKVKGYFSHPQDLPPSLWSQLISDVTKLQSMQAHDPLGFRFEPDRSKALKNQLARFLADAHTLDTAWKGTFSGNLTPGAKKPPPAQPIGGGLEDIVPLIIGGPATPVFDIGMGGPSMGFAGGGSIHPFSGRGFANGGQVGLQQIASMFAGVMPASMLMPTYAPGGISDTLLRRLGMANSASDEVPRKLSQAGAAHKAAFNVEQLNINNPVAEQPSLSIARASNRMAFLAGRGDS